MQVGRVSKPFQSLGRTQKHRFPQFTPTKTTHVRPFHLNMASKELIRAFESYKSYYDRHGSDESLIAACIEAAKTAFKVEEDEKYGLQITQETKKYINEIVKTKTGAGFFDLEKYAMEHDLEYDIINSGYDVYRLESYSKFESYML